MPLSTEQPNPPGPSNPPAATKPILKWLLRQSRPARTWILLTIAAGSLTGILIVGQARIIAGVLHQVMIAGAAPAQMGTAFTLFLLIIALRALLAWAREICGFQAAAAVRSRVRRALIRRMVALGPAFTRSRRTGALSVTLLEKVDALHGFFAFYLPQLALAGVVPLTILAFVLPVSWAAGGMLLLTAPLIPLFMIIVGMGAEAISQRHFQALSRLSAHFLDVLQGLPTLRLLDQSRAERERIRAASADYRRRTMAVLRIAFISSAVLEFFTALCIALTAVYLGTTYLGYTAFGTYGAPLTLQAGLFILILAPDFFLPLRELGVHYHARADALAAGEEILKILDLPVPAPPAGRDDWRFPDPFTIQFDNVSLTYDNGRRPALCGISFTLNQGEEVVLAGPSGAGKTSILHLILGFLHPDQGGIRINTTPLAAIPPDRWRAHLAWIGQDPLLFHGTIRENIRMARPDADETAIQEAVRRARVDQFTGALPDGLETVVGEMGHNLSRGQAQRIALARAFVRNAPILLLDEPTAGLDPRHARLVMAGIRELKQGRTILTLTHDPDQMAGADRGLRLSNGTLRPCPPVEDSGPGSRKAETP